MEFEIDKCSAAIKVQRVELPDRMKFDDLVDRCKYLVVLEGDKMKCCGKISRTASGELQTTTFKHMGTSSCSICMYNVVKNNRQHYFKAWGIKLLLMTSHPECKMAVRQSEVFKFKF